MIMKATHVCDRLSVLSSKLEAEGHYVMAESAHLAAQRILELEATVRTLTRVDLFKNDEQQRRDAAWLKKYAADITEGNTEEDVAQDAYQIRRIADRLS